ncbi:MarR family winged helix-turn-helix transcriptional regulator [Nakamurella sp.]|uniref:MarR family winged helix-turn-helix transcriptional regulator n=1 Tax=Nakamurella sp. TaxID=1869182 RepID=UPI003B3B01D8
MGTSGSGGERSFSGDRKAAWEGFLQCQARLMQRLGHELEDAGKIPLSTYDVLAQLAESGGRLRLRDLVDRVVLSQPGLSRKVARLAEEGLVDRLPDPTDGRGVVVRLTRSGRAALRSAAVVHIAGVERLFTDRITDDEARVLAGVFDRLQALPPEPPG